jgi:hypothetical protein
VDLQKYNRRIILRLCINYGNMHVLKTKHTNRVKLERENIPPGGFEKLQFIFIFSFPRTGDQCSADRISPHTTTSRTTDLNGHIHTCMQIIIDSSLTSL